MMTSGSSSHSGLAGILATTILIGGGAFVFQQAKGGLDKTSQKQSRRTDLRIEREGRGEYYESWLWNKRMRGALKGSDYDLWKKGMAQVKRMPGWGGVAGSSGGGSRLMSAGNAKLMGSSWPGNIPFFTWEFTGPQDARPAPQLIYFGPAASRVSGRVNDVAYDPTDPTGQTIYLGASNGGVWKTTDGGQKWDVLSDFTFPQLQIGAITVTPEGVVLAGLGDYPGGGAAGTGVMRSEDGGRTWTQVAPAVAGGRVSDFETDPDNPKRVFMAVGGGNGGVYRSLDGGLTWTKLNLLAGDYSRVSLSADNGFGQRRLYASRMPGGADPLSSIYRSDDRGDNWSKLSLGVPGINSFNDQIEVCASPNNYDRVYYVDANGEDGRIFLSESGGEPNTWTYRTGNFPDGTEVGNPGYNWSQFWYDKHINVGPSPFVGQDDDMLYVGGITIAGSVGANGLWTDIGRSYVSAAAVQTHSDQHQMAFSPVDPTKAIITNDGGVYNLSFNPATRAWDLSQGWAINKTLGVTEFYAADWHPSNPDHMMGGTQDNSSPHSLGDLLHWNNVGAGDGFGSVINPQNPNFQYTSSQFGNLIGTTNGWASRFNASPPYDTSDRLTFFTQLALTAGSPNLVYTTSHRLWVLDQNTGTWTPDTQDLCPDYNTGYEEVTALAPAPSTPALLYVGTSGQNSSTGAIHGKVWMRQITIAGIVWSRLDVVNNNRLFPPSSTGAVRIASISVNPQSPVDILVGTTDDSSNATNAGVRLWRCRNTLATNPQFIPVSGLQGTPTALPSVAPNCIERHPDDPFNTFFVGSDLGVFVTRDAGATWYNVGTNYMLPPVSVRSIKAVRGTGYLNIATFGRGMWRIPLSVFESGSPFSMTPSITRNGNFLNATLRVNNAGTGTLSSVQIVSSQLTLTSGTSANGTTTQAFAPPTLGPGASGSGRVQFAGSIGRPGTLATLRINLRYTLAGKSYMAQNNVAVRLP